MVWGWLGGIAGSLLGWLWGSSGLSLLPQRRQEERQRRRRRVQQQEMLLAESLGKHPLQNRYGRPGNG